jgi:hypothetical protein
MHADDGGCHRAPASGADAGQGEEFTRSGTRSSARLGEPAQRLQDLRRPQASFCASPESTVLWRRSLTSASLWR